VIDGGPVLIHSFDAEGVYEVRLKLIDEEGAEGEKVTQISVYNYLCEQKNNYAPRDCVGTYVATTFSDLENYAQNFGLKNNSYQDLQISFPLDESLTVEIHSPCKIKVTQGLGLKAQNLCLDARGGTSQLSAYSIETTND